MKVLKKAYCSIIVCLLCFCAHAQIKSYVGVVRGQLWPEMITFLESYRDELKTDGYTTYAKYIDAYLDGGFGSGFVYVAPDGTNYIITNRHVVSQAATASIEFENSKTDKNEKYENLSVFATDDDIDIAILAFPEGEKPFKKGLSLSVSGVKDGDEVWSAGFPGLGNNPVWQLGKGNVSNSNAKIKELLDPAISSLIQHSAQVDSGNSGGPLMVVSKNDTAGYAVVGINTWKAIYRQSTNFAIPSKVIIDFINRSTKQHTTETDLQTVAGRSKKFAEIFKDSDSNFTSIAKFISYKYALETGRDDFEVVLRFAPSAVRNTIISVFSDEPTEGLRYATAYKVWKQYRGTEAEVKSYSVSEPVKTEDAYTVQVCGDEDKKIETSWIYEHGLWCLGNSGDVEDASSKNENKKNKKSFETSFSVSKTSTFMIQAGSVIGLSGKEKNQTNSDSSDIDYNPKPSFNMQISVFPMPGGFFGFGLFGDFESVDSDVIKYLGGDLVLRLPLNFTSFAFSLYGSVNFGIGFTKSFASEDSYSGFGNGYEIGLIYDYYLKSGWRPGLGISYYNQTINLSDSDSNKNKYSKSGLKIFITFAY